MEPKLYVFDWYNPRSDHGFNHEFYITLNPQDYSDNISRREGLRGDNEKVSYREFVQEGFKISIKRARVKLICTAKCPELDLDDCKHCVIYPDKEDVPDECPCGNSPKWEEL